MHLALRDTEDGSVLAERARPPRAVGASTPVLMSLVAVAWQLIQSSGHDLCFLLAERRDCIFSFSPEVGRKMVSQEFVMMLAHSWYSRGIE